jgi:hypothetical protein
VGNYPIINRYVINIPISKKQAIAFKAKFKLNVDLNFVGSNDIIIGFEKHRKYKLFIQKVKSINFIK